MVGWIDNIPAKLSQAVVALPAYERAFAVIAVLKEDIVQARETAGASLLFVLRPLRVHLMYV